MEDPQGIVEASFVRKSFYFEPPAKGAPVSEWQDWLEKDKAAASTAKRAHTKSLPRGVPDVKPAVVAKIGGVYKQTAMVGLVSEGEGLTRLEPIVEADQEKVVTSPWLKAGGRGESVTSAPSKKSRSSQRRANKKAMRRFNKGQVKVSSWRRG